MKKCDFCGYATRNDLLCSDGLTIRKNAFKDNDGKEVPLIWNHRHNTPDSVLGHALLENREDGVYAYCTFNDTEMGLKAKKIVRHGDVKSLSICANHLKKAGSDVLHGMIREVSLVLAGANEGAYIDYVIEHGDDADETIIANYDENIMIMHADEDDKEEILMGETPKNDDMEHSDPIESKEEPENNDTLDPKAVYESMNKEQQELVDALVLRAYEDGQSNAETSNNNTEGDGEMKHNIFENEPTTSKNVLCHAEALEIVKSAKTSTVGSLQAAIKAYVEENDELQHADLESTFPGEIVEQLFPDYKDVNPGAPELIERDQSWVSRVMSKVHKSPISRIRTRQVDVRDEDLRALGYKKGDKKAISGAIKMVKRTTDPQTVYRKDALHRDDIIDITDFSVVDYQYGIMKSNLYEELATAILIGDGRDDVDEYKISEDHIRSIWNDDELYTIHTEVDLAAAKAELQGSDTSKHFGDNYVFAEAVITAALYSREKYKGSGNLDFYCTPRTLNKMLLARDLNGRRIYSSKADLAAALNVNEIYTVEQFEGKTRTGADTKEKKLLGLFVNLSDYQAGATKGGEITKFSQFDIDFNTEKMLIETRMSGALTKVFSAIALEEPVTTQG